MGRYKKILVAIDGSESSMHALSESFKLAANEKSWVTVVSVVPSYTGDLDIVGVGRDVFQSMRRPYEKAISDALALAKAEGASIKTVYDEGEPYERIVDIASAKKCDLIVMARRGLKRLERVFVGSVTARVIGHSSVDVLVVPKDTTIGWQKILLTTDGSKYSKAAAERAIDIAKSYGGELKIISVVDVPSEFYAESPKTVEGLINNAKGYVEGVKKQAVASGVKAEALVREGEVYRVITDIAKEQKADIIVTGSHGRTGLRRLLMGSVTEKVIGHAPCPVLVVRS